MLFLALVRAHGVLCLRADKLGCVAAHDAPAVLARGQAHLVLDSNRRHRVLRLLQSRIDLQVLDCFFKLCCCGLSYSCFVTIRQCFSARIIEALSLFGKDFNSRLVKAYIVDHVLDHTVNVLVLLRKGHFKRLRVID